MNAGEDRREEIFCQYQNKRLEEARPQREGVAEVHFAHFPMATSWPSCQGLALCWASPGHTQVRCLCLSPSCLETQVGGYCQELGGVVSALHKVSPLGDDPCCGAPAGMALESEAEKVQFGFFICLGSQFKADSGPPRCAGHG